MHVILVVKALKRDVIRSIIARCELLCEDLLQAEEEQGDTFSFATSHNIIEIVNYYSITLHIWQSVVISRVPTHP